MHRVHSQIFGLAALCGAACTEPNISKGEARGDPQGESEGTPETAPEGSSETDTADEEPEPEDTGTADTRPCASGEPIIEIGTGEEEFESINNGDNIEIIHGTQDGHHILGSLRTKNTTEIAAIRFQIIPLSDGISISDQTYRLMMLPDGTGEPCAWTTVGMYAYLGRIDPGEAPFLLNPVVFKMDLVDDNGREVSQSLEVIPFIEPADHSTPPTDPTE